MGFKKDKHGNTNRQEPQTISSTVVCQICGSRVQDLESHNALFHPVYRKDPPLTTRLRRVADPQQQGLEQYPDTGESGETYDAEKFGKKEQR
jgi:hypothetical protein